MSMKKYVVIAVFAVLVTGLFVSTVAAQPTIDGVFTPGEWGTPYPGADPTPKGTYIYFKRIGDWIYLCHDLITDNYPAWADTNYFPLWYTDGTKYEVWIHAVPNPGTFEESHLDLVVVHDHNELTGTNVGYDLPPYYFQGKAGFGSSENSGSYHRIYEFRVHKAGFWKIETEDIVISSESEENANWGGSVAWNPTGLTRYAAGTNTADWDFFWVHEVERGGLYAPVDKIGLLAPYIGVTSTIVVATVATAIYAKRVKRRKEK